MPLAALLDEPESAARPAALTVADLVEQLAALLDGLQPEDQEPAARALQALAAAPDSAKARGATVRALSVHGKRHRRVA